jgi:uncharacterized protein YndB with AHSA1/START domain
MNGELASDGHGRWTLRFRRTLAHPIDEVWRALTDPDELAAWFPQRIVGDLLTAGAPLRFESDRFPGFEGRVLQVEPPVLLELAWGTDVIRFDLAPRGRGCRLTLTDTFGEVGKAARDAAGWHACLDLLEVAADHAVASFSSEERWRVVHAGYVEAFGPDASTQGPPPHP